MTSGCSFPLLHIYGLWSRPRVDVRLPLGWDQQAYFGLFGIVQCLFSPVLRWRLSHLGLDFSTLTIHQSLVATQSCLYGPVHGLVDLVAAHLLPAPASLPAPLPFDWVWMGG